MNNNKEEKLNTCEPNRQVMQEPNRINDIAEFDTEVMKVSKESLDKAAKILKEGNLVAFPTETVYGLGADALRAEASARIYAAKGRPSDNPLIVHIATCGQLPELVREIPDTAKKLMDAFWPGPLTIIFNKSEIVPKGTTGGLDTVAIRMPNHPDALALIRSSGVAIAAPSANTSGKPSPTTAMHVFHDLKGKIPLVLDGGNVGIGIESTIVDVTGEKPMILRPGYITKEMLEEVIGEVEFDRALFAPPEEGLVPKAPGMKYRHYAPKADFTIYEGETAKVVAKINELASRFVSEGKKVGIIACDETMNQYTNGNVVSIGTRKDDLTISQNLYRVLRDFDESDTDIILGESFTNERLGEAIMNRLTKAAGYQIQKV